MVQTKGILLIPLLALGQVSAAATPVVGVQLQDPSTGPDIHSMQIALDRETVPAGRVTFRAVNQSKDQIHELIVLRTKQGQVKLPYDQKRAEVEEKHVQRLGEIPDLKPGASGAMTLNLRAGSYMLICNQPGHYAAGMATNLIVTR